MNMIRIRHIPELILGLQHRQLLGPVSALQVVLVPQLLEHVLLLLTGGDASI